MNGWALLEVPEKTGRRTKAAHRTPTTGHGERAPADAPFGARLQGTVSPYKNVVVFCETAS